MSYQPFLDLLCIPFISLFNIIIFHFSYDATNDTHDDRMKIEGCVRKRFKSNKNILLYSSFKLTILWS